MGAAASVAARPRAVIARPPGRTGLGRFAVSPPRGGSAAPPSASRTAPPETPRDRGEHRTSNGLERTPRRRGRPHRRDPTAASRPQEDHPMARIDWSILSGPRVSRRTLIALAAASGAAGYASRLAAAPLPTARFTNLRAAQGEP